MQRNPEDHGTSQIVEGDFVTDGTSFVFRLKGTPIAAVGDSPQAAFEGLLQARAAAGNLVPRLEELAREQRSERERLIWMRSLAAALIALFVGGGVLAGAAALAPKLAADLVETTVERLGSQGAKQKLHGLLHDVLAGAPSSASPCVCAEAAVTGRTP